MKYAPISEAIEATVPGVKPESIVEATVDQSIIQDPFFAQAISFFLKLFPSRGMLPAAQAFTITCFQGGMLYERARLLQGVEEKVAAQAGDRPETGAARRMSRPVQIFGWGEDRVEDGESMTTTRWNANMSRKKWAQMKLERAKARGKEKA